MMEIKSLKHNFFMYSLRMLVNLSFSLIAFPYVARVLRPSGIGEVQFAESIVAYFLLFINLGIANYGRREVAFVREDKEKLTKLVLELVKVLFFTTIVGAILYFLFLEFLYVTETNKSILYVFSLNIIFNFLGVEWFYEGIENQTYITTRIIIFKLISIVAIFLFIKTSNDITKYTGILVFSLIGSNILNFMKLFKYIDVRKELKSKLEIKKHLKPLIMLFFSTLALSISYNLDSIMINKIAGIEELGYYSFASKMGKFPTVFTGAICAIFFPRLCNYLEKKDFTEYKKLVQQSITLMLLISIPASIGMYLTSDLIILLFAGKEYINAIVMMKTFAIYVFVVTLSYITGSLTLIANKMEKIFMYSLVAGSFLNFLFNLIFIPILKAEGAAIATIITEIIAIIIRIIFGKKLFKEIKIFNFNHLKIILSSLSIILIVLLVKKVVLNLKIQLILSIIFSSIVYCMLLIIFKEEITKKIINKMKW